MFEKDDLIRLLDRVNLGNNASSTDKQAILAAIARLEERNPTPKPLESPLIDGNWRLLYTTSTELLNLDRLPLYRIRNIYQCVRVATRSIYNIGELEGIPSLGGLVSVEARFEPLSDRRVDVIFQRFVGGLQGAVGYTTPDDWIARLSQTPRFFALDFSLADRDRRGWLDITYLDETLRIGRGNVGSVFILAKVSGSI
ncbi:MAG: fibrillin [Oscillatoriales cyanobacterium]|nr:MAG: fibrillin [Oscillatoriales cyanobacterium]